MAEAPSAPAAPVPVAELPVAAPETGRYRISLGAFGSRDNAENLALTFRDEGYPVFLGTQGELFIVLVGPYDELEEAERVSGQIEVADNGIDSTLCTPSTRPTTP